MKISSNRFTLIIFYMIIVAATSCGTVRKVHEESSVKVEDEFINPFGYFTIKRIEGEYIVIPDVIYDEEYIRTLLQDGGWSFDSPRSVTPTEVSTDIWIGQYGSIDIFGKDGKVTSYYDPFPEPPETSISNYSIVGNQLIISRNKYIVCHIDCDTMYLFEKYTETEWFLHIVYHRSEEKAKQSIEQLGFKHPFTP